MARLSYSHKDRSYKVRLAVLVDDVEAVHILQNLAIPVDFLPGVPAAVPTVVRLQPLDSCPVARTETANRIPLARRDELALLSAVSIPPGGVVDRKHGGFDNVVRNLSAEMTNMQLKGQIIKRRPNVVQGVAEDKGEIGVQRLNLTDVEAVLQAIRFSLKCDGPSLAIEAPMHFFEGSVVLNRPVQLGYWSVK